MLHDPLSGAHNDDFSHARIEIVHLTHAEVNLAQHSHDFVVQGGAREVLEYAEDHQVLFHARVTSNRVTLDRVRKTQYIDEPLWPPTLFIEPGWIEGRGVRNSLTVLVSWNGAVDVHSWQYSPV